jgi:hypothetical protein
MEELEKIELERRKKYADRRYIISRSRFMSNRTYRRNKNSVSQTRSSSHEKTKTKKSLSKISHSQSGHRGSSW